MAVDMFLKIDSLNGESIDKAHTNEIDVLSYSWGLANSGTAHSGSGSGGGKASFHDLSVSKYVDLSSSSLMLACANGKHFDQAVLTVRKAGENPLEYVIITMTNVMVTGISTGAVGSQDRVTENISLNFSQVSVQYTQQLPSGGGGAQNTMGWNIAGNAPA